MAEFIESIGFLLLISGALLAVLSHVLLMAGAREANPMWALVPRIPLGNYLYVATHWDDAKFPFCVHLGGTSMVVAGAFMVGGEVRDSVLEMTGFKSEEEEVSPYDEPWGEGGFDTADDWNAMSAVSYPSAAEPEIQREPRTGNRSFTSGPFHRKAAGRAVRRRACAGRSLLGESRTRGDRAKSRK